MPWPRASIGSASCTPRSGRLGLLHSVNPYPNIARSDAGDASPARATAWRQLADRRIYFGHQSVGQNIIDGMHALCMRYRVPIQWNDQGALDVFDSPVFAHSRIGRNRDPLSKIDAFGHNVRNGIGGRVDIALFKLCYVDVVAGTETDALFGYYAQTMAALKSEFPRTLFAHVTVPLTVVPRGWRRWLNNLRGQPTAALDDNVARTRFNDVIRATYAGHEPLFDLAAWETGNSGRVSSKKGQYQALRSDLSSDDGHLSGRGQAVVGAALLDFLSMLEASA